MWPLGTSDCGDFAVIRPGAVFDLPKTASIMAQQLDFAVGASVILIPQYGVPLFLASTVGKLLLKQRNRKAAPEFLQASADDVRQQVSLQWSHITCSITTKSGEIKQLLEDQSAVAEPNRF